MSKGRGTDLLLDDEEVDRSQPVSDPFPRVSLVASQRRSAQSQRDLLERERFFAQNPHASWYADEAPDAVGDYPAQGSSAQFQNPYAVKREPDPSAEDISLLDAQAALQCTHEHTDFRIRSRGRNGQMGNVRLARLHLNAIDASMLKATDAETNHNIRASLLYALKAERHLQFLDRFVSSNVQANREIIWSEEFLPILSRLMRDNQDMLRRLRGPPL